MKKIIVIALFIAIPATATATQYCWKARRCDTGPDCHVVVTPATAAFGWEPGVYRTNCGHECQSTYEQGWASCTTTPGYVQYGDEWALCASIQHGGPGCCSVPCSPPAVNCEPN